MHYSDLLLCPKLQIIELVEHSEIDEHWEEIAENLILEHLLYTISIATYNRTPQPHSDLGIFSIVLTLCVLNFSEGI